MNKEDNHIIIEVLNSNGDIKLTKMRDPRAIWQNNEYPDEYIFKDVNYVNIFSLIQENLQLKEEKDKIDKMYLNAYKYSQKMEDKYILTKSIIDEVRELRKEFLDVNENQLIVFENNELIVFMNKLHDILNKVGDSNE